MAMSESPKGRAKLKSSGKKPAPTAVARDFVAADKGKTKSLPKRAPKRKKPASNKLSNIKTKRIKPAPDTDNSE